MSFSFGKAFLGLHQDLQDRILLFLSPDDLGVLSRCVEELAGIEEDEYLRRVWFRQTVPSRLSYALFSPVHARPDPEELVRRGTLRGVAIINGVRNRGYWCSESAVRISQIHHKLHQSALRRLLTNHLEPNSRQTPASLHARRILPYPTTYRISPIITGKALQLQKQISLDSARRAMRIAKIGQRSVEDYIEVLGMVGSPQGDAGGYEGKGRVRWAICPSIKGRIKVYEALSAI